MEQIWGKGLSGTSRAADVHVRNIRKKIEFDAGSPRYSQTIRGSGHRFADHGEYGVAEAGVV